MYIEMKKATESLHFETEKRWRSAQKFDTIDAREDAKMTLGEKISKLRKQQNYTQEQLADILGVSRQTSLSHYHGCIIVR